MKRLVSRLRRQGRRRDDVGVDQRPPEMTAGAIVATQRRERRLRRLRVAMIVGLGIQVCLGMANNLWLHQTKPNLREASPQGLLSAHTTMADVLVALGVWLLIEAIRLRESRYVGPAATGIAGLALAFASGEAYWATESSVYSMSMTIGFAIASVSYALIGRQSRR